jgi:hypothetical protein
MKHVGGRTYAAPNGKNVRRRPTLPHAPACSTIGAEELNFRVRNGAGCFPFAMVAETLLRYCRREPVAQNRTRPYLGNRTVDANSKAMSREDKPSAY